MTEQENLKNTIVYLRSELTSERLHNEILRKENKTLGKEIENLQLVLNKLEETNKHLGILAANRYKQSQDLLKAVNKFKNAENDLDSIRHRDCYYE